MGREISVCAHMEAMSIREFSFKKWRLESHGKEWSSGDEEQASPAPCQHKSGSCLSLFITREK